jgi:hypothetical protein
MNYWMENPSKIPVKTSKPPDEANGVDVVTLQGNSNPEPAVGGKVPDGMT